MEPVLRVNHSAGSYPVFVETGVLSRLAEMAAAHLPGRRLAVITDRNVARAVSYQLDAPTLVVPPGERAKSRARWAALTDRLLDLGMGRDAGIVALGGGVVGDLAGFVAATYLRGIPYLQVPTSLLAMVDSSVGGKTGINTRHGKNLVGGFYPPVAVLADPAVLSTLHPAHLRAGLVEALKHGLVADAVYLEQLEGESARLLAGHLEALGEAVRGSVRIKAGIVAEDEHEQGRRAVLNAGHTVGHAIEQVTGYQVLHGEAVAIGLLVEARLAEAAGHAKRLAERVAVALERFGLPTTMAPEWDEDALVEAMRSDKKVRADQLRFALLQEPGVIARTGAQWTVPIAEAVVRTVLRASRGPGVFSTLSTRGSAD